MFFVTSVAMEIKYRFKEQKKESAKDVLSFKSTEDKLAMLKVLLDEGILTQEEFDYKQDILLSM